MKDENFFVVHGWMLKRLNLKGNDLIIFAIIYGFSQDGESEFKGSIKYLCEFANISRSTAMRSLKFLEEQNLIIKTTIEPMQGIKFNNYKANLNIINSNISEFNYNNVNTAYQNNTPSIKMTYPQYQNDTPSGIKMIPHNNNIYNIYNKEKETTLYTATYKKNVENSIEPNIDRYTKKRLLSHEEILKNNFSDTNVIDTFKEYLRMRYKYYGLVSNTVLNFLIKQLKQLSNNPKKQTEIIIQSINNNLLDFVEI